MTRKSDTERRFTVYTWMLGLLTGEFAGLVALNRYLDHLSMPNPHWVTTLGGPDIAWWLILSAAIAMTAILYQLLMRRIDRVVEPKSHPTKKDRDVLSQRQKAARAGALRAKNRSRR